MLFNTKEDILRCPHCNSPYFTVSEKYVFPKNKEGIFSKLTGELNFVEKDIIISCSECRAKISVMKKTNSSYQTMK